MAGMQASRARTNSHGTFTSTTPIANWQVPSAGITCGLGLLPNSARCVSLARSWMSPLLSQASSQAIWLSSLVLLMLVASPNTPRLGADGCIRRRSKSVTAIASSLTH